MQLSKFTNLLMYGNILKKVKKKSIEFNKKGIKKFEIQVIVAMIMLTCCSERIFNPSRYTGNTIIHVKSIDTKQTNVEYYLLFFNIVY